MVKVCAMVAAVMFLSLTVLEVTAHARAGGSRSSGSRGSRSYAKPASPYTQSAPRQQMAPGPQPFQQARSGGFLSSMAGGIAGGLLGGMLFRSLGMAGGGVGGMAGGGIGMFEIILLAGIGYLIYRFVKNKRAAAAAGPSTYFQGGGYQSGHQGAEGRVIPTSDYRVQESADDVDTGLMQVRQMDPGFDERGFSDTAMDIFFKVQSAWMNRDLSTASAVMTDEIKRIFQQDLDRLLRDKQVNRLENIAVRKVEIAEVWQESGYDYITALIHANLLDYTTDELTGAVVAGSKTDSVKFEEYWSFTRPVGNNQWRLSGIDQK